jgi:hypothetical protein
MLTRSGMYGQADNSEMLSLCRQALCGGPSFFCPLGEWPKPCARRRVYALSLVQTIQAPLCGCRSPWATTQRRYLRISPFATWWRRS